ncbi:MAG TPA: response regulator [Nitrospiria bacterium]|nr:response regulator [Nitrospiria bacterium]HLB94875.1 response regulator [Nitrospiria bacterium]
MNRYLLAVVDDLLFHSKIQGLLSPHGYTVKVIPDPVAAADHARRQRPALVIIDLGLGHGDPFELIKVIKGELALPVLAYTRHTDLTGMQKAMALGCDKVVARSEFFDNIAILVESLALK